jgi:CheY-like chemotaxis protein
MPNNSIIIIEDDKNSAKVLQEILEIYDISVLGVAFDGKDGLDLLNKVTPDKILLDMTMPNYDGFYFLERVPKEILQKIIVCSGDVAIATHTRLENYPIHAFHIKPIEIKKLVQEINS